MKKESLIANTEEVIVTSGQKTVTVSPEDLEKTIDSMVQIDSITLGITLTRSPKSYDSNKYSMYSNVNLGDTYNINFKGDPEEVRKTISKVILKKTRKCFASMKSILKEQLNSDGIEVHNVGEYESRAE